MLHQTIEAAARPGPESKWTAEVRTRFLDHLARRGSVRAACLRVGVSAEIAYRLRRRDEAFARGWAAAMVLARGETEQVLAEQAVEGVIDDVYYRGQCVGSRRRHDARLLLAHLARLDKLAADPRAKADAERFDEILAVVAGEEVPEELGCADRVLPVSRRRHVAQAGELARIEQLHAQFAWDEQSPDEDAADEEGLLDAEERWQRETAALEAREAACDDAAAEAMFEAGREWDGWQARARAAVDRLLAAAPPPSAMIELAGNSAPGSV
jgi:hypothetical protein